MIASLRCAAGTGAALARSPGMTDNFRPSLHRVSLALIACALLALSACSPDNGAHRININDSGGIDNNNAGYSQGKPN